MIKYLGSKRKLLPLIVESVNKTNARSVIDLFSGTSRVGHVLKAEGFKVISNDYNAYAHTLATCYVQADKEDFSSLEEKIQRLNEVGPKPGYFTKTFCEDARFIHPTNGARIDAIRNEIQDMRILPEEKAVLLTSLLEAADRVDSTCGIQMAYLKKWAKRANNGLILRAPDLLTQAKNGKGEAYQMDALEAAKTLSADCAYLDPPYNQHSYLGNYHMWETLVRWDAPECYGKAMKRVECRERKSSFNSKVKFRESMRSVIDSLDVKDMVVSFSNEGFVTREEMEDMLSTRGDVETVETDYQRYVGAKIGIHNPSGKKTGEVTHTENKEYTFLVRGK